MDPRVVVRQFVLAALALLLTHGCTCGGNPPPVMGITPVPTGTNSVACNCAIAQGQCGLDCCDPMTGNGTDAGCTNTTCSTVRCCDTGDAGTGDGGPAPCTTNTCNLSVIGCCDTGTGGMGQPGCFHATCNTRGNCNSRTLSVCVPPNTTNLAGFCNSVCQSRARSAAVITGLDPLFCGAVTVVGGAIPKGSATAPIAWNDASCTGSCANIPDGGCNVNSDCGIGGVCTAACPAITCTAMTTPPFTNNFCFGTTGPTCCNVVPVSCSGQSAAPICRPALGDPPGMLTAFYSLASTGVIDHSQSSITLTTTDGVTVTTISPQVRGAVDFTGRPCPGASCSVGVTFEVFVDNFSALGASFSGMALSAGTLFPALNLSPASGTLVGTLDGTHLTLTAQGTASRQIIFGATVGGTQAVKSQPLPGAVSLDFDVDYVANTFTMASTSPFTFPATTDMPAFAVSMSISGHITNQPPRAVAATALKVACDSPTSGSVTLDGRGSSDPNSGVGTFSWLNGPEIVGTFVGHAAVVTTAAPFAAPGPTTTHYTLQVTDAEGQVDTAKVAVTVTDEGAPVIQASVSPDCLWAPNHGLVLLTVGSEIQASATDACSAAPPPVYILDVTSDQPELGGGQGNHAPDFFFGTGAVCLRSERQGSIGAHRPRTYTITLAANDSSQNQSMRTVQVRVPHDQSGDKCPKVSPSLIVPEGDPRCTYNLPEVPTASQPLVAPPKPATGCSAVSIALSPWLVSLLLLFGRRRRGR